MASSLDPDRLFAQAAVELQLLTPEQLHAADSQASSQSLRDRLLALQHWTPQQIAEIDQAAQQKLPADTNRQDSSPAASADPFATRAFEATPLPAIEQRYTLLRTHQQGGLGLISIARDEDFNREVVVKEILPAHADADATRKRFIREAEITGALEHPGVVPVYSLGYHADGRPYYVMRFVHGVDMQQAIMAFQRLPQIDKALRFTQLLGRFVDVCNTIHYAHNRGVLHRDLKPSNIMLGDYGETIVVDWGLAKASGETGSVDEVSEAPVPLSGKTPSDMTADGRVIGTPIYMSPEQAAGRIDQFGVTTDVYGLGATLYCLLAGSPPIDPSDSDILGKVRSGEFPAPRSRVAKVPAALNAICLKAMALKPSDRYASAGELAVEVERWLADQPVLAYRESVSARAWRWVRTHRAQVMSLAAAVLVGVVAMSWHLVRLSLANERITAAKNLAEENLREANVQRTRAERNAQMARDAVREYYVRVSAETLLNQPGMQPLRNDLLRQAMQYYQSFLQESGGDPLLQSEVATAHYYIGKITQTIEGPAAALVHLEQAADTQQSLTEASESSSDTWGDYARTLNAIGSAHRALGQPETAFEFYEESRILRQQLAEAAPGSSAAARELANSFMNIGVLYAEHQQWDMALEQMQHAQAIRLAHLEEDSTLELRRDSGKGSFNLSFIYQALGQPEQAAQSLSAAVDQFENLRETKPNDIATLSQLASCYRALADLSVAQEEPRQAVQQYQQAEQLMLHLVMANPESLSFAVDLAGVRMNLGHLLQQSGDTEDALKQMLGAVQLLDVPEEQSPTPRQRRDLGVALRAAGRMHSEIGNPKDAMDAWRRSQAVLKALVREHPGDPQYARDLAETEQAIRDAQAAEEEATEKAA